MRTYRGIVAFLLSRTLATGSADDGVLRTGYHKTRGRFNQCDQNDALLILLIQKSADHLYM